MKTDITAITAEKRMKTASAPGETIRRQLKEKHMSQKEFALRMDLSEKHISRLVNGDVQLTPAVAERLEIVLGVPSAYWNRLEAQYREKLVKAEMETTLAQDIPLAKNFPYQEMSELGWVPSARKAEEKVMNLRKFFGVVKLSLLGNEMLIENADLTRKQGAADAAWQMEAGRQAEHLKLSAFSLTKLNDTLPSLRELTVLPAELFCPLLDTRLSACGTGILFVPGLKGSSLTHIILKEGESMVIALKAEGWNTDSFWHTLFDALFKIEGREEKADDFLIEKDAFDAFRAQKDTSLKHVLQFAGEQGIAAGIAVGRMQRSGMIRKNELNSLKEAYPSLSHLTSAQRIPRL